jgi:serpin B
MSKDLSAPLTAFRRPAIALLLFGAVVAGLPKRSFGDGDRPSPDVAEIVRGGNQFSCDFYAKINRESGNLFFSPYGISTALAMSYAGARGETARQMAGAMHWDLPAERLHAAMAELQRSLIQTKEDRGYQLHVANRLWRQREGAILPAFLTVARDKYGAAPADLDFANRADESRRTINAWVERHTEGRVTDLIPEGGLGKDTRLVVTNAVYFNADWFSRFDRKQTKQADFRVSAKKAVRVPLMFQKNFFVYKKAKSLKALELPYGTEGALSMVVLLPDQVDGLAKLEADLTADNIRTWTAGLETHDVEVHLPKFQLTTQYNLAAALQALGMKQAFTPGEANLSGIDGTRELFINGAWHKAFIDVNEERTEAAAAGGFGFGGGAIPKAIFRADHPFLFFIRDNRTSAILFLGRVTNPQG